ncbi:MAG: rRNA pseudouridine synthase [Candidatus Schekmanbacteria bacterium]|nr:rRNA pseudouridine synthase [Candidatus Schekmanbacteria bacterium]
MESMRLQKFLSQAGICSRRKGEEYMQRGLIAVNGKIVRELGTKISPEKDHITLRGRLIKPVRDKLTVLLYKPKQYVTTLNDPENRPTVSDLVKNIPVRLFPIGRLDYHSEGLILLTSDGDLAQALSHPKHEIEKVYWVKVEGIPGADKLERLRQGVKLDDGITAPCKVRMLYRRGENCWIEIILTEGRNRQIRRMIDAVSHSVIKLKRVRLAFLTSEGLSAGQFRILSPQEVKKLKRMAVSGNTLNVHKKPNVYPGLT